MITPSFALTATERVLPRLALDFTTASLDPRVTFTRTGNTATVVNSSGYVVGINADLPRFDYNPTTLACKGLLIEEARTNLWLRSSEFNSWTKTRSTVNSDVVGLVSPDGTQNADKLVCDSTASNTHRLEQNVTTVSGSVYTMSVFAKAAELPAILIREESVATGAFFNLTNGTVGSVVAGSSATITDYGNGWYRCTMTYTQSGTLGRGRIELATAATTNSNVFSGNGVDGVYLFGAQWELGAFPTSYIPTVASQVTRNADVATMTGTNFSDWYNASEGAFQIQANLNGRTTPNGNFFLEAGDGGFNNRMYILLNTSGTLRFSVDTSSVRQFNLDMGGVTLNTSFSTDFAYKNSSFASSTRGTNLQTNGSGTVPTVTTLYIGRQGGGGGFLNGWAQKLNYWPQRITNAEIQAFSK